ncbi:hypothetical protein GCM10022243_49290 [Saccharothrix violaceirubra]|uniref:Excisionase family DNA binding protein n=1 Tax=Saccharothrix violaceirubra TaxID=413306 RepID=A0A7W7SZA8_9PSEU|nr:helix-turn-helix domain-containing protein [Saccharothrix violaceirubra]MBB4963727.1 excisionase family DNA binding protein [Saccharothrix violaceirubra]
MTYFLAERRALAHRPLVKIAYTVPEAATALGKPDHTIRRLIARGVIRSRNTGSEYLIAGGTLLDLVEGTLPGIVDHRDVVHADDYYLTADLLALLPLSEEQIRGLVHPGNARFRKGPLVPTHRSPRLIVPGSSLLEYLNGEDAPIRHSASA